ncbi:MAG TPA: hypothetical protein VK925_10955 [Jiangellaceae bacterium]|nr:hypothetical protein [Jiangellaceae bacterium]
MNAAPPPRPALRRTAGGKVRPVAPHLSSLAVDTSAVAMAAAKKAKKKDKTDVVQLTVVIPKRIRKQLRRKAAQYGWTAEEAAAQVLGVWAEE